MGKAIMSTLIVLGNLNHFTFANSIVAANNKAAEIFSEALTDIFVIHSSASQAGLNKQTDWVKYLESHGISQELLIHRVIEIDATPQSVEHFIHYIEIILNAVLSKKPNLIVDLTNGTSLHKNLLSTTAYILGLSDQYLIDIVKVAELTGDRGFLPLGILNASYVQAPDITQLDSIAYLSLAEIIRYRRLIEQHSGKYTQIDAIASDKSFFAGNIEHSIRIKMKGDRDGDNAMYRIAASSISASVEDLISILIDKFITKDKSHKEGPLMFGNKLKLIEKEMQSKKQRDFDFDFFTKFNEFIRFLRNSSTHKGRHLTDIERFKADLSVKMTFPFIGFYTDIVYPILASNNPIEPQKKISILTGPGNNIDEIFYFGLDGDDTGSLLEELFLSSYDEAKFKKMSNSIMQAIDEIKKYISINSNNAIIFAAGDDILFKGNFNESALHALQQIYQKTTSGLTCSIGYGRSLREVYVALKFAKAEPGKNSIVGIEIV